MDRNLWFASPLGRYLLDKEQAYFDEVVADIFGYNAVQLGMPEFDLLRASRIPYCFKAANAPTVTLYADGHALPIAGQSVYLVLIPHVLEFSTQPHQILREAERVLRPEGQLIISGFNPLSLWGLCGVFQRSKAEFPWSGKFITLLRIKDWLALLGLEVTAGKLYCYAPPFKREKWLRRFQFMEAAGDRWWGLAGGVYFVTATKRVRGMRLIVPAWDKPLLAKPRLASVGNRPRLVLIECRRDKRKLGGSVEPG
ncbi:MAG: class I SAM-dependent methyltransferase [Burkholderiales bacterium]